MSVSRSTEAPRGASWLLVVVAASFLGVFLVLPAISIFSVALSRGGSRYVAAITHPDAIAAIELSLISVAIAVPLNTFFGVAAAWAITRFAFRGKAILLALIDLPFAVSPVVVGLMFVFLFGARGLFGPWLLAHDLQIIYATPGIVIATVFVTFPFVARELIPLMDALGSDEEIAAASLGANGWWIFRRVTLPSIRWGLLYGVLVCTARAAGEFGAVSVVSGHVRGGTNTMPLHIEVLYNEYDEVGAFAVASLLGVIGVVALIAKKIVEWRIAAEGRDREHRGT
jgi:sulfate/thiosulfate transport system permease protein